MRIKLIFSILHFTTKKPPSLWEDSRACYLYCVDGGRLLVARVPVYHIMIVAREHLIHECRCLVDEDGTLLAKQT